MNNFNVNQNEFNDHQILDALQRQMAENGVPCNKEIILDGTVHRYSKDQKKNQPNEWYIGSKWISPNNYQYITVTYGSWSDGSKFIFRSWDKTAQFLDEKERREIQAAYQKRREEAEKLIEETHHQVSTLYNFCDSKMRSDWTIQVPFIRIFLSLNLCKVGN